MFLIFLVQVSHRAIQRPLQVPRMMGSGGGEVWGPGRECSFPRQVRAPPGSGLQKEARVREKAVRREGGVRARQPEPPPRPRRDPQPETQQGPYAMVPPRGLEKGTGCSGRPAATGKAT